LPCGKWHKRHIAAERDDGKALLRGELHAQG
jgi:hypothetical protein